MRVFDTELAGVKILQPHVFRDDRGEFHEVWHKDKFRDLGLDVAFVQDNHSVSNRHVLRGLHYQVLRPQGKLVRCVVGEIYDVAVDIRRSSSTFGAWFGLTLSADNHRQLWIPEGFAHGFFTLSEVAHVCYKCSEIYIAEHDRTLAWNDPNLGIGWPIRDVPPVLSEKDRQAPGLQESELYR